MNLCKDCKHVRIGFFWWLFNGWEFAKCAACPNDKARVGVGGRDGMMFAANARSWVGKCGPEGKLWEPKP